MKRALFVAVIIVGLSAAGWLIAQPNVTGNPTYGTYSLTTGFQPDPTTYAVTAGGTYDSAQILVDSIPCGAGFIAMSPDIRIHYTAGTLPLIFYADTAGTDPTLAINDPSGQWHCNDDFASLMPRVEFATPISGQYDIFVGTFSEGDFPSVTLHVSELAGAAPSN